MKKILVLAALFGAACAPITSDLPSVTAVAETAPVASRDDAADDPAIWVDVNAPERSVILGTDKQRGLYVYDLTGSELQFLQTGAVNNVDVRQDTMFGDIAAASNRSNNTIALYAIDDRVVRETGAFPSQLDEPYGICLGVADSEVFAFVAYKTGDLIAYRIDGPAAGTPVGQLKLETQLEGCVFDDETNTLYVGEEVRGIWKTTFSESGFSSPQLVDEVAGHSGVKADVEGLAIYYDVQTGARYLIASSQGNNSFTIYAMADDSFVVRFVISAGGGIDGAQETDGIEAISTPLGPDFPKGILVVQDGRNHPRGQLQNFKILDWRDIERLINGSSGNQNKHP